MTERHTAESIKSELKMMVGEAVLSGMTIQRETAAAIMETMHFISTVEAMTAICEEEVDA